MTTAPKGEYVIEYQGRDISGDVRGSVLDLTYTDELTGTSDSLELRFEDGDGRWRDAWFPAAGDRITLALGWAGAPLLRCGEFVVDEPEFSGPPDIVSIHALAAPTAGRALRTRRSRAFDQHSVADLVETVAAEHELTVLGEPPTITHTRFTQRAESDLAFLRRVADEHGYAVAVRGSNLVFFELAALHAEATVATLNRRTLLDYNIRASTATTYSACVVTYKDGATGQHASVRVNAPAGQTASGDVLRRHTNLEKRSEAQVLARSLLSRSNANARSGSVKVPGSVACVSGMNIDLADFAKLDGKYSIRKSSHRVDRASAYTTELELAGV